MIIFVGTLFTLIFTFFIGLLCNGIAVFIDMPSLLVIILPLIFFSRTTKSGRILRGYIKSSFKKNYEYSESELEIIATATKNTITITMAAGWFGVFAGLIGMLANLDNPAHIGPSLAVGLITVYYAIAISYFIFFPVQAWAENKAKLLKHE